FREVVVARGHEERSRRRRYDAERDEEKGLALFGGVVAAKLLFDFGARARCVLGERRARRSDEESDRRKPHPPPAAHRTLAYLTDAFVWQRWRRSGAAFGHRAARGRARARRARCAVERLAKRQHEESFDRNALLPRRREIGERLHQPEVAYERALDQRIAG